MLEPFIPVFSPGVTWYADKVVKGEPFSFVKFGNGDWKRIIPNLPEWRKRTGSHPKSNPIVQAWENPAWHDAVRESVLAMPKASNFYPAVYQQPICRSRGWLPYVKEFLDDNWLGISNVEWHGGNVWRQAVEVDKMERLTMALRSQPLPVVLVGLDYLSILKDYLPVEGHVVTYMGLDPIKDTPRLEEEILTGPHPAIFVFCCGLVGKMLIHSLFPTLGEESTLIDFGSTWDGYCGHPRRGYHKALTPERVKLALEGR